MKRILLMGNPNVGKSVVFSRLTGIHVVSSNYPGTTVEFMQGTMRLRDEEALLIDVPGTYGLEATCKAEEIAVAMLAEGDLAIDVVDATNLERNLHLTLHLIEEDTPIIVALNVWDEAVHKGIHIDVAKLEAELGVPVVPTVAVTGEGIRELVGRIGEARCPDVPKRTEEERWTEVGRIVNAVQAIEHRHHTFLEWLGDVSVRPTTGLPMAVGVLLLSFAVVRLVGETLIGYVFEPIFDVAWRPLMDRLSDWIQPNAFIHDILIGHLIDGEIDFVQSFGVLTTGLFVPITMVLPYIFSFYALLGFLEDIGYLPRLAVLLDTIMHRLGLHGWAIIPMLLGMGCNVPGVMATRVLEGKRERFIAATLVCIAVPCAALQAMIWESLGGSGLRYVAAVYAALFVAWVVLGRILNALLKGESPELILEIPSYRLPSFATFWKKLQMRMLGFFREAIPIVILGVLVVNVLYFIGVMDVFTAFTAPVITRLFGLPRDAVVAIVMGFLRKDVAVGMLDTLNLTPKQLVVSCTVLAMSFPCIATFVVLAKELGWVGLLKSVALMLACTLIAGTTLNWIL
ncbi:MAG TPA: ferrous iron transporter B [Candidatus Hydrogenedentes bacterium]|nr:ferrous iron transporter B [Candidatus Hydrogenedentota bacterium]HPG66849.1 ferrous iron transporter B [Candidatus Hydrogenedentota bacterium]